jgi:hypothetical protein
MKSMVIAAAGLVAILSLAVLAGAQHAHDHAGVNGQPSLERHRDERLPLGLNPAAEAGLKLTMREHLETIREIVAALGRQDFEQAASVAHEELGFPKHHQAMAREAGATFPPKYHELAMAHHQEAEDLAKVLVSKNLAAILPQLEKTIGACVACHRAYRL